jgi:hypothetical protein
MVKRFNETSYRNETHLISTMTLKNVTPNDTGVYKCENRRIRKREVEFRLVYVFSKLFFSS